MIQKYRTGDSQQIVSGIGALAEIPRLLERLGKKRAFILTGSTLATKTDLVSRLENLLGDTWVGTFSGCKQHVLNGAVERATEAARECDPDVLISFGGGSPTDTTKHVAMNLLGERPREELPQITIPTTLSAGEFTFHAGVTDEVARVKSGRRNPNALPSVVIFDPEVTVPTPPQLWAATGMKAFDHAVEKLWSPRAQPYSDALALDAIRRLNHSLLVSVDPANLEARLDCQLAAWMSMSGVMNLGLRLTHPFGHQIGARWDVPHGVTSCIVLPTVMRYLQSSSTSAQEKIAQAMGASDPAAAAVETLIASLDVPRQLRDTAATKDELPDVASEVSRELVRVKSPDAESATPDVLLKLLNEMW